MAENSSGSYKSSYTSPTKDKRRTWVNEDFSGGLVTSGNPGNAKPNQLRNIINFEILKGGALEKRQGTKVIDSLFRIGESVDGVVNIFPNPGDKQAKVTFWLSNGIIYDGITREAIPYFSYLEFNEVIEIFDLNYKLPGEYIINDPTDLNYLPLMLDKDGNRVGDGWQFQLNEGVIYWLIGNKIYMYPYEGGWDTIVDSFGTESIRVDYFTGQPNIKGSSNVKVWIELYHFQPLYSSYFTPGINLLSDDPQNRVVKFVPTIVADVKAIFSYTEFQHSPYEPYPNSTETIEIYDVFDRENLSTEFPIIEATGELYKGSNKKHINLNIFENNVEVILNNKKLGNFYYYNYFDNSRYGMNWYFVNDTKYDNAELTINFNPLNNVSLDEYNDRISTSPNYASTLFSRGIDWELLDWELSSGLNDYKTYTTEGDGNNITNFRYKDHFMITTKNEFYNFINYNSDTFELKIQSSGHAYIGGKGGEGDKYWEKQQSNLNYYMSNINLPLIKSYLNSPLLIKKPDGSDFTWYVLSTTAFSMTYRGRGGASGDAYITQNIKYFGNDSEFYFYSFNRDNPIKNDKELSNAGTYLSKQKDRPTTLSEDKSGIFEFNLKELNFPDLHIESDPTTGFDFIIEDSIDINDRTNIYFRKVHEFEVKVTDSVPDFSNFTNFFLSWTDGIFDTFVTGWNEETLGDLKQQWYEINNQLANLKIVIDNIDIGTWTYISNDPIRFVYEIIDLNINDITSETGISYKLKLYFEGTIYYIGEDVEVGVDVEFKQVGVVSKESPILAGKKTQYQLVTQAKSIDDSQDRYYQWQTYLLKDIDTTTIIGPNLEASSTWTQNQMNYNYIMVSPNEAFVIYVFSMSNDVYSAWKGSTPTIPEDTDIEQSSNQFLAVIPNTFNYKSVDRISDNNIDGFHIYSNQMMIYSGTTIWMSDLFNFGYFPSTLVYSLGDLTTKVKIQSIQYIQGTLVLLTNQNIYTLSGDYPTYTLTQINADYGTIAKYSPHPFENGIAFLTNQGIYKLTNLSQTSKDNLNIVRIDSQIQDLIEEIPFENKEKAVATLWRNKYMLAIPNTQSKIEEFLGNITNTIFVYDHNYNSWTKWEGEYLDVFNFFKDSLGNLYFVRKNSPDMLIYGYNKSVQVPILNSNFNDIIYIPGYQDGYLSSNSVLNKTIYSKIQTVEYNMGKKGHNKKFKKLYIFTSLPSVASSFDIKVYTEMGVLLDSSKFILSPDVGGKTWSIKEYSDVDQNTTLPRGQIISASIYDLAKYDQTIYDSMGKSFFKYSFNLSGEKAKTVIVEITHNADAPLDIYWFSLDYKIRKAK